MAARLLQTLTALALLLGAANLAQAASALELSPPRLEARAAQPKEVLVRNPGASPLKVDLVGLAWDQGRGDEAHLTPTHDLAVTPATLTLAPGESRAVQVKLLGPAAPFERSYQLVATEQLADAEARGEAQQVAIPVFVEPEHPAARAELSVPSLLGCTAFLELRNSGNAHLEGLHIRFLAHDRDGNVVAEVEQDTRFLLSGVARTVSELLPHAACNETTALTAEVETGAQVMTTSARFTVAQP